MAIVFFCQGCGARFDVDAKLAGRSARCKGCGKSIKVPPADPASPAPVRAAAAVPGAPPRGSWIAAATSNVALAPLTVDRIGPVPRSGKKAPQDPLDNFDIDDRDPYALAGPAPKVKHAGGGGAPAGMVKQAWRKELGGVQRFFRWLNETAYLVSVPFLMAILLGVILKSTWLAHLGATVVVLLNAWRLAVGLANVAVIPFRESPLQGILFLIPPLTFVYMYNHWNKVRRAVGRVVGPLVTVGLVVLAYAFLPFLRGGSTSSGGTIAERVEAGASAVKKEVRRKVDRIQEAVPTTPSP